MIMTLKKASAALLSLLMLLPFAFGVAMPASTYAKGDSTSLSAKLTKVDNSMSDKLMQELFNTSGVALDANNNPVKIDDNEIVSVLIVLDEPAFLSYEGLMPQTKTAQADNLRCRIQISQKSVLKAAGELVGDLLCVTYRYLYVLNAIAVTAPYGAIKQIAQIDGVKSASVCNAYLPSNVSQSTDEIIAMAEETKSVNDSSYKGEGMTIAILDTGLRLDHPLFLDDVPNPAFSREYISNMIENGDLMAKQIVPSLTVDSAYIRTKIPYQFDYGRHDTDASHDESSVHGTHVAGIACGNEGVNADVDSVAPHAQLLPMKVFKTENKSEIAYEEDILAAIEDCAILGVDAINMSFGAPAGFSASYSWGAMDEALTNCYNSGVLIGAAAGNDYHAATAAQQNYFYGMNPDYGIIHDPSTFMHCLSVAASTTSSGSSIARYSSWGAAPNLELKPEISAFGDSVFSSIPQGYTRMSGTSMATPHVVGGMAVIKEYLQEMYPSMSPSELYDMSMTLLMNTAIPIEAIPGKPVSPRVQGAGFMDIMGAVSTPAYISVPGCDKPKFDRADDVDETGVYEFTFVIHNLSGNDLEYEVQCYPLTEEVRMLNGPTSLTPGTSRKPRLLSGDFTTGYEGNLVTIPANDDLTVTATLSLPRSEINYIKSNFIYGCYVEGFIRLIAQGNNDVNLTVPFLNFFGDYTRPPTLDPGYFYQAFNGEPDWTQVYSNKAFVNFNSTERAYVASNPVGITSGFNLDRTTLSPNGDGNYDLFAGMELGLVRNCKTVTYSVFGEDGTVYYEKVVPYARKTMIDSTSITGALAYCGYYEEEAFGQWRCTDAEGNTLDNNTRAYIKVSAQSDFDFHEPNGVNSQWVIPVTIDTEAPQVTRASVSMVNGRMYLDVTVHDNHYAADITLTDSSYENVIYNVALYENESGLTKSYRIDITDQTQSLLGLVVTDYGANRSTYALDIPDIADYLQPITGEMLIAGSDFEAAQFPPSDFTVENTNDSTWHRAAADTFVARVEPASTNQEEWLILPSVNLADYQNQVNIAFNFSTDPATMTGANSPAHVSVRVSKNGGSFQSIYSTRGEGLFDAFSNVERRVRIPYDYQDALVTVAIVYEGHDGARFDLDNVYIYDNNTVVLPDSSVDDDTVDNALNVNGGNLTFSNDSAYPFIVTKDSARLYARSGNYNVDNSESRLTLNAGNLTPGMVLSFEWKVSSEPTYDLMVFSVNGAREDSISGYLDWTKKTYTIRRAGEYEFTWTYIKNTASSVSGDVASLDNVRIGYLVPASGIEITPSEITLDAGQVATVSAQVLPVDAFNRVYTFTSSNTSVATVNDIGVITAKAAGQAIISAVASEGGYTASSTVTVLPMAPIPEGFACVRLTSLDPWGDGSGYQLLLDSDADTFGTIIPLSGPLTLKGDASSQTYAAFEHKIPADADGAMNTDNVIFFDSQYIIVPVGTYDICVTNPVANDRIWIANGQYGRCDNITFEEGYEYSFRISELDDGDNTVMTSKFLGIDPNATPVPTSTVMPTPTFTSTPAPTITPIPTPISLQPGDVNHDGEVNTGDVAALLMYVVGTFVIDPECMDIADINGDGRINTGDAAYLLYCLLEG